MAKLIERVGSQTAVDRKPIDLSKLVHVGTEPIVIDLGGSVDYAYDQSSAISKAKSLALQIAGQYGCDYAMLGLNTIRTTWGMNGFLFIASFYNDKK